MLRSLNCLTAFPTALNFCIMRNSTVRFVLASGTALLLPILPVSAFPWPFGKKVTQDAPSAPELQNQEGVAADLLSRADAALLAEKASTAQGLYKEIVRKYPLTQSAAVAQFNIAKSYEQGNPQRAFEEYQTLIETYKATKYFGPAIDSQFGIAQRSRTDKLGSFLGLKKKMSRDDTLKLFNSVVKNAPQGNNAAEAKFEIGKIHEEADARAEAIAAYQDVVDEYPKSTFASQAQKKIADLNFGKVEHGTKDAGAIKDSRDAAQQAVSLFPDSVTEESRDLLPQIDEKEAENAYGIAKFYERTKNYKAAMIYYRNVLKFPGGTHFEDAKERVNALTMEDPTLLDQPNVKISNKQLAIRAKADVKSRPDYLGPPAPVDLEKATRGPKMRSGATSEVIPITPIDEPALPGEKPMGKPDDSLLKPSTSDLALPPVAPLAEPELPADAPMPEETKKAKKKK